jgi:hypothetical protein
VQISLRDYLSCVPSLAIGTTVLDALLWLAVQLGSAPAVPPADAAIRADAVMRRAWLGRSEAMLRICGDPDKARRMRLLDAAFGQAQQAYQARFGALWQGIGVVSKAGMGADAENNATGAVTGQTHVNLRCQSPTAFAGALGEYWNGVTLALVEMDQ